jgi:hypothetical protein
VTALAPVHTSDQSLPSLIERAATMLSGAKTAAEVLEAREAAGLAYDTAKRAARLSRAKAAHDDLIAAAHRAQADALEIEAAAKRRLADEYDAAQARGEVASPTSNRGNQWTVSDGNGAATASELGLTRKVSTAETKPATRRRKTRPVAGCQAPWCARSSHSWRVPWRIGPQGQFFGG